MKYSVAALLATALPAVSARFVEPDEVNNVITFPDGAEAARYLIELGPGDTRWVTEEEKWELRRVSIGAPVSYIQALPTC